MKKYDFYSKLLDISPFVYNQKQYNVDGAHFSCRFKSFKKSIFSFRCILWQHVFLSIIIWIHHYYVWPSKLIAPIVLHKGRASWSMFSFSPWNSLVLSLILFIWEPSQHLHKLMDPLEHIWLPRMKNSLCLCRKMKLFCNIIWSFHIVKNNNLREGLLMASW